MSTKWIAACIALAALVAFALPATASATNNADLTEGPTRLAVGAAIVDTATNAEFQSTSGGNLVTCTSATKSGEVGANSGGNVEAQITTFDFKGTGLKHADNGLPECTGTFGNAYITVSNMPLCLASTTTMATDEFQITSGACPSSGMVKFIIGSTTAGACEYESTNPISAAATTNGTQATLTVFNTQAGSGSKKIAGGFLCPSSVQWKMSFGLETPNGIPVIVS
jgi:hypothetical protein